MAVQFLEASVLPLDWNNLFMFFFFCFNDPKCETFLPAISSWSAVRPALFLDTWNPSRVNKLQKAKNQRPGQLLSNVSCQVPKRVMAGDGRKLFGSLQSVATTSAATSSLTPSGNCFCCVGCNAYLASLTLRVWHSVLSGAGSRDRDIIRPNNASTLGGLKFSWNPPESILKGIFSTNYLL